MTHEILQWRYGILAMMFRVSHKRADVELTL